MYIAPNSDVRILKGLRINSTYENSLYFNDLASQETFFISKTKYSLTDQYYVHVNDGVLKVEQPIQNLQDCNYMMFRNVSFGNKWFYAFINKVEYVNNVTSRIYFEIDVLQTYHFDYTLKECYVERQHSATDNVGDNLVSEGFETGEFVLNNDDSGDKYRKLSDFSEYYVIVAGCEVDGNSQYTNVVDGQTFDNIYSGLKLKCFIDTDVTEINSFLAGFAKNPETIVGIYMCPRAFLHWSTGFVPPSIGNPVTIPSGTIGSVIKPYGQGITTVGVNRSSLDGYQPTNKKLYTYPYNFLQVDNASGQSAVFKYEYFENLNPAFEIDTVFTQPVCGVLRPLRYKNVGLNDDNTERTLNTECLTIENFPQCSWNTDSFKAWLAQVLATGSLAWDMAGYGMNASGGLVQAVTGASTAGGSSGTAFGAGSGVASGIFQIGGSVLGAMGQAMTSYNTAKIKADILGGNVRNANVNVASKKQNFYTGRWSVNRDTAIMIDNYFTMYGYRFGRVTTPNTHVRPHYTYTKTVGCAIIGNCPQDDIARICAIYDNGIRFWKNGDEVGEYYNLDNAPV